MIGKGYTEYDIGANGRDECCVSERWDSESDECLVVGLVAVMAIEEGGKGAMDKEEEEEEGPEGWVFIMAAELFQREWKVLTSM